MMLMPFVILAMAEGDDRDYMEWLYKEYKLLMYGTAWRYVSDPYLVEDIVSDSCVALIRKISVIRDLDCCALRMYIVSCVRNTAFNSLAAQKKRRSIFVESGDEVDVLPDDCYSPEQKIELQDELEYAIRAIHALPEKERQIMQMKYLMHMDNAEIAKNVDLTLDSVRVYISRARKHLKELLYAE